MKFILCIFGLVGMFVASDAAAQPVTICMAENHPIHRMAKFVLQKVYKQARIEAKYISYPSKRSLMLANTGVCAAEVGRISRATEIFTNLETVVTPIYNLRGYAFVKKNSGLEIEKWDDLKNYRVAVRRGEIYAAEGAKKFRPVEVGDYKTLFTLVENGRIDVAIGLWISALDILAKPGVDFNIQRSAIPLHDVPFYHLVHKDFKEISFALNIVLLEWQKNGRLKIEVDTALEKLANGTI